MQLHFLLWEFFPFLSFVIMADDDRDNKDDIQEMILNYQNKY